jgi:hypothetical protein
MEKCDSRTKQRTVNRRRRLFKPIHIKNSCINYKARILNCVMRIAVLFSIGFDFNVTVAQ